MVLVVLGIFSVCDLILYVVSVAIFMVLICGFVQALFFKSYDWLLIFV